MKFPLKRMSCVTCAWTNGKVIIPLDFDFWTRKKDLEDEKKYKKKTKLSMILIDEYKEKVHFAYAALDGDYGNKYCFDFLHENKLKHSVRIPKSRIVLINGIEAQLKNHKLFKFKKNEKYKMAKGTYKGQEMYFIAHKRNGPNVTKQVVFIASNIEGLTAKQHVEAFALRWPIEKMFRTLKQSLGIKDCQSTSVQKQRAHIFATFVPPPPEETKEAISDLEKFMPKKNRSTNEIQKWYTTIIINRNKDEQYTETKALYIDLSEKQIHNLIEEINKLPLHIR